MNKQVSSHKNFSAGDYKYLRTKGYSDREIVRIWNQAAQTKPQNHAKQFDAARYFAA